VAGFQKFTSLPAFPVSTAAEARRLIDLRTPNVIGVDEAQFFGDWMADLVTELLERSAGGDLTIIAAGLDMDAWRRPFGIMPKLLSLADEVKKETAICFQCSKPAIFSQKLGDSQKQIEVGDADIYEAHCRLCHTLPKTN